MAARMAERQQFMTDQQVQPGTTLVATTPEQIEFTTRQREFIEANGAQYSPDYEDLILALALNACETSILSGHKVDAVVFAGHVATSPQLQALTSGRSKEQADQITRNLTEIMRDGTHYLCPADYPQWKAAWDEAYGK